MPARLALLALALLLPSCALFPTVCVKGDGVVIGADDRAAAQAVLPRVERRVAEVRALLPATDDDRVVFRLADSVPGGFSSEMDLEGAYFSPLDWAFVATEGLNDHTIAHEAVHALLGPRWDPLPLMLEEGLCDVVAARLTDDDVDHEVNHAAALWQLLPSFRGRLVDAATGETIVHVSSTPTSDQTVEQLYAADMLDLWFMDRGRFVMAYVAGAFLVERIVDRHGYEGLLALCDDAALRGDRHVALDAALARAELTRSWDDWRVPALEAIDERVARALADTTLAAIAPTLDDALLDVPEITWVIDGARAVSLGTGAEVLATVRRHRAEAAAAE